MARKKLIVVWDRRDYGRARHLMNDLPTTPPIPPLQRHLQLETDLFCFGCGYNLHGQVVTQDDRLGFLVCRCPECGKFHPAAMGVSASRPWLARLGVMLVVFWVLMVLAIMGLGGFFTGMCTYAHLDTYTIGDYTGGQYLLHLRPPPNRQTIGIDYYEIWETEWRTFVTVDALLSIAMGVFIAAITWHLPPRLRLLFLLFPLVVQTILMWIWTTNNDVHYVIAAMLPAIGMYTFVSAAGIAIGLRIGRPIVRFLVRLIIPARLRQHVNFLWTCDGKTPPAMTA